MSGASTPFRPFFANNKLDWFALLLADFVLQHTYGLLMRHERALAINTFELIFLIFAALLLCNSYFIITIYIFDTGI